VVEAAAEALARDAVGKANELLGAAHPDVTALHHEMKTIRHPPLLHDCWMRVVARSMKADGYLVERGSPADHMSTRVASRNPWLMWISQEQVLEGQDLLEAVADNVAPGWDRTKGRLQGSSIPTGIRFEDRLPAMAWSTGTPLQQFRDRVHKVPPVDQLVARERIAFVGASNDQLAAALTLANLNRGGRRWRLLELFFLADEALRNIISNGRAPKELLEAKAHSLELLGTMLPIMAERYQFYEYDLPYYFASYWDWDRPGGFIHVSPYIWGMDVRRCPYQDLHWRRDEPGPSSEYEAYQEGLGCLRGLSTRLLLKS